jgi:putative methyltransferase (TIGR04325 family)
LASQIAALAAPPRFILLNLLPVVEGPGFVTLQNIGPAFCPYAIWSRGELVDRLRQLGYALVDSWENAEKACTIPFHPDRSVRGYSGFLFDLRRP